MIFLSQLVLGQYTATTSASNKVKDIKRQSETPVEVHYQDGRVAQVMVRETTDTFKVPIVLTENSCQKPVGIKCQLVIPFARQQFAAVWKNHPTRKGQALEYSFNKTITFGQQLAITRMQNELYETILKRIDASPEEKQKAKRALEKQEMGHLECEKDLAQALPKNAEILFWDEIYENGNSELALTEGPIYGARVNLVNRRYQGIPLDVAGPIVRFSRYKKSFGPPPDNYPMGLSYMKTWSFRSENQDDPSDELCKLKWDVNFSVYFAQISALAISASSTSFQAEGYKVYRFSEENLHPHSQNLYKHESWEHEGLH